MISKQSYTNIFQTDRIISLKKEQRKKKEKKYDLKIRKKSEMKYFVCEPL